MLITYFGHSHFLVEGREYSLTLDPYSNIGLKEFKTQSTYVFCSHEHYDHCNRQNCQGEEVAYQPWFEKFTVYHDDRGGALRGENTVLFFKLEGFTLAFLGDIGERLNEALIDKLKGVDLMFVPVGGNYTIDDLGAYEYAVKSGVKTIIPMHYNIPGSTVDIEGVEPFLERFESYKTVTSPFVYSGQQGVFKLLSCQGEEL